MLIIDAYLIVDFSWYKQKEIYNDVRL